MRNSAWRSGASSKHFSSCRSGALVPGTEPRHPGVGQRLDVITAPSLPGKPTRSEGLCWNKLGFGYNELEQPSSVRRTGVALCVQQRARNNNLRPECVYGEEHGKLGLDVNLSCELSISFQIMY